MKKYPIFLSVVLPIRNFSNDTKYFLENFIKDLNDLVSDYELIIVDNASVDNTIHVLKGLAELKSFPNMQVYALRREVDFDAAAWVGIENALGDYVVVINYLIDEVSFVPTMIDNALNGFDIVFANNLNKIPQSMSYRFSFSIFNFAFKKINNINIKKETSQFRLLSRVAINLLLKHYQPIKSYRYLSSGIGFSCISLNYHSKSNVGDKKGLIDGLDRGIQLLVSTTKTPMRLVTMLSLFGAFANAFYSVYVVFISILGSDVAPGWVSLSLQQSGMFFLISLVLLVLGEYILHMASFSGEEPSLHISQEFGSAYMTRHEKLNIEESNSAHDAKDQANYREIS